ncbi:MAG: AMP-binding protein, partial [Gemmatimonadota bacterium]
MSVLDVLGARAGARDPDGAALVTPEGPLTWSGLADVVDARAGELLGSGVEPGALLPLVVDPDRGGIVGLLAAWRAGVVPAPLNARLTEPERARAREALVAAPPDCQAVLWTSGTSGQPRGVALGRAGLLAHVEAVAERLELDGSEVWLASLSPAHVGGLALVARAALTGATIVVPGRPDMDGLLRALRRTTSAVTHVSLVPTQLDRLVGTWGAAPPPPELRCILIGGAHAPPALVRAATQAGWPIALTYGMTEMWSQVATAPPDLTRQRPGTVGAPLTGVEVRIAAEQEILVRGPT